MAGHSKHNGQQSKSLARDLRAKRGASRGNVGAGLVPAQGRPQGSPLQERIDRAVALADTEQGLGARGQGLAETTLGIPGSSLVPGAQPLAPGFGFPTAPLQPVPAPAPVAAVSPQAGAGLLPAWAKGGRGEATFGVSGTPITSGFLIDLGEYNPELMGRNAIVTYEKMRRGDAQVRATLAAVKLPVQSAIWEIVAGEIHPSALAPMDREGDQSGRIKSRKTSSTGEGKTTASKAKEIARFVRDNLFGGLEFRNSAGGWVTQSWDEVVRNALLMVEFGAVAHEDVWMVDGERLRLRRLAARLPLTFFRWHVDTDGETLLALEQWGYRGWQFLNALLPADKIAVFTYQQEGANFWGIALPRAMYPHWYIKTSLYRIDAIACERNALGIPVFKLSPGFSKEDHDAAYNYVTQLAAHESAGLVEPPGDPVSGLRIVGTQGRVREVMPSIQHHNQQISMAALAMFMNLGTSESGSRALGKEHSDFFLLALQNLADQIAYKISATSIRRLVYFNFGEDAPCPRLLASNVQARSLEDIADALTRFAQAGLVVSEENLRRFVREQLALPEESKTVTGDESEI